MSVSVEKQRAIRVHGKMFTEHVTRITIQSIFDALNEEQSQMSKEHPFNIQKHS